MITEVVRSCKWSLLKPPHNYLAVRLSGLQNLPYHLSPNKLERHESASYVKLRIDEGDFDVLKKWSFPRRFCTRKWSFHCFSIENFSTHTAEKLAFAAQKNFIFENFLITKGHITIFVVDNFHGALPKNYVRADTLVF